MSARRSSQPSVQLFPFLAVLMCALGALILILLVTTTRIRDTARARATVEHPVRAAKAAAPPDVVAPIVPPRAEWKPLTVPPVVALRPVPVTPDPVAEQAPPTESLREQWLQTVVDLEATAALEESAVQSRVAAAEAEESALKQSSAQLAELQQEVDAAARRQSASGAEVQTLSQRAVQLQRLIDDQQSELKTMEEAQQAAASRYSILPYDGRTGTVRRPIYIECTESGLTFASEHITVTPDQLNGFPAYQNPLRAGADALIDYWTLKALKDPAIDNAGQPYVLLIVRPRGTVGYYVARRMLESLGQAFGYELVPDDLEIQWPETDVGAVQACQAAIDDILQNRGRYAFRGSDALPGSLEPLSVSDGQGRFALEEVEKLRGSGRAVHFGGQTYNRDVSDAVPPSGVSGSARTESRDRGGGVPSDRNPAPSSAGGTADAGAESEPSAGSQRITEAPVTTSRRAAAEAAEQFSAAAARARQNLNESAGSAGGQRGTPDATPRPLPSLDALERDNLAPNRRPPRNPTEVLRDPGRQIGLERKVVIRVNAQRVTVESEPDIELSGVLSREELQAQLAETLRNLFSDWGRPPRGFYWLPQVKFSVLPGGQQHVKRLSDLTDEWEIKSEVNFALE